METRPSNRTIRLLEARLEELALVSERAPDCGHALDCRLLDAAAATRLAVRLELMSVEEADRLWAAVARRHPRAPWRRARPDVAA